MTYWKSSTPVAGLANTLRCHDGEQSYMSLSNGYICLFGTLFCYCLCISVYKCMHLLWFGCYLDKVSLVKEILNLNGTSWLNKGKIKIKMFYFVAAWVYSLTVKHNKWMCWGVRGSGDQFQASWTSVVGLVWRCEGLPQWRVDDLWIYWTLSRLMAICP